MSLEDTVVSVLKRSSQQNQIGIRSLLPASVRPETGCAFWKNAQSGVADPGYSVRQLCLAFFVFFEEPDELAAVILFAGKQGNGHVLRHIIHSV